MKELWRAINALVSIGIAGLVFSLAVTGAVAVESPIFISILVLLIIEAATDRLSRTQTKGDKKGIPA